MKLKTIFYITIIALFTVNISCSQNTRGKIVLDHLYSSSLENTGGENPTRSITIYLPPGYDNSNKRYPVIYFLHGFTSSDRINFSWFNTNEKLDLARSSGKIQPFIFVISNQFTTYRGSFYTNSKLNGNWADFTAIDVVKYIDNNYRTIPKKESRGIAGWSMGGYGAIKISMLYPGIFGALYCMSPACLAMVEELEPRSSAFKKASEIKSTDQLLKVSANLMANGLVAMGRAFSPDPDNPPFYTDLPYTYIGDSLVVDSTALQHWKDNIPLEMNDTLLYRLKTLNAIKFDWGDHDYFKHIPVACKLFSEKLDSLGIQHAAEEYYGSHDERLWTKNGRALNEMFPFFNAYLKFE